MLSTLTKTASTTASARAGASTNAVLFRRFASSSSKPPVAGQGPKLTNPGRANMPTRFPTVYNPYRSAANPWIKLPKGLAYNPPPAPLSAYETPSIFLPQQDKRTVRYETTEYAIETMPELSPKKPKKYQLTENDALEIQKLRLQDPYKWTKKALAAKFDCSELIISIVSDPAPERVADMQSRLEKIRDIWSPARAKARKDRKRRQQLWLRDV